MTSSTNKQRVLVVHNTYQHRGGEDSVVEAEVELLNSRGHCVELYRRNNDDIHQLSKIRLAAQTIWSDRTTTEISQLIKKFAPNIIHVHNTLPLVSPSVYWAASKAKIPVVQTLHNFRLLCPQALMLRNGEICEDCVGKISLPAIRHACYRDSTLQTAVVSATIQFHRYIGTWQNKIARYIALNEFCKDKFVQGGIPEKLISIKPNFIDLPAQQEESRKDFLFVGRLSVEKGISVLAQAAKAAPEVQINVVGTGPEEENIKNISNIIFHGPKETKEVYNEMHRSYAIIVPSVWYENFPRTIVEAYACGTPVIASRIGALSHLIKDGITGILFKPNDPNDLAQKLQWALRNPEEIREMGKNARSYYENHLTADSNYKILTEIYEKAMHNA